MFVVLFEKTEKLPDVACVGVLCGGALTALTRQVRKPSRHSVAQIAAKRQLRVVGQDVIERFAHADVLKDAHMVARNSRAEPINDSLTRRYSTLPGFRMPDGSSAALIARMMSISTGDLCRRSAARFICPMPCSAEI